LSRRDSEDVRRKQLIDTTIHVMAQVGFNATTLGLIAKHAGVSAGLVAHYFGDKDGLLEATLRSLASRLSRAAAARMRAAETPRARLQAVIDANLAPEEMDSQTSAVWLAFWGQAIHSERLKRVQRIYQLRVLSNLRHALRSMTPDAEAERLAVIIAAIIDGLWLRTTLAAAWSPADSEAARRIAAGFVDTQLAASIEGLPMSKPPADKSALSPDCG
jgi:betaine-aldehyde dehydrogenase